ncbi:hypothetical protein [Methanobacterium spitsbergense]|uniref:Uncharacterized protein n=1 Tax=Methanobacterium spitsbergense TaxID=2874285 RepID=A0A8T5UQY9_9EURY|nr:hypothetical protein [Methanobacterium spitsbergense]MBZ2164547.1 hypothetical protein [Methanobacterium spitsbergense]
MVEVKILEFGYSLESNMAIMKFFIKGLDKKTKEQMLSMLENIPLGELKRFEVTSDTNEGIILLERFSEEEYPFQLNIPSEDEVVSVENMVKKFMSKGW